MIEKTATRPNYSSSEALTLLKTHYGLQGNIEELPSERDRNFHLITDQNDEYVLKIAGIAEALENLESQNATLLHLSDSEFRINSPKPIPTLQGEIIQTIHKDGETFLMRLVTYLVGSVFSSIKPHSNNLLLDFGKFLGNLTLSLNGFSHPGANRDFYWDLKNAGNIIGEFMHLVDDPEKFQLIKHFLDLFETNVTPQLMSLRKSVIHSDANDYNVIVDQYQPYLIEDQSNKFGIIDFGDMVESHTVFEVAIASAYALLHKEDPLHAAGQVVRGYHSIAPLTETEISLLYTLICARLCMSVVISNYQYNLEPDNTYLLISQKPGWEALFRLRRIHSNFAHYTFRHACQLPPYPNTDEIKVWLSENQQSFAPILQQSMNNLRMTIFDLSVGSLDLSEFQDIPDTKHLTQLIANKLDHENAEIAIGRYNESRLIYTTDAFQVSTNRGYEWRTVHLGIDLFTIENTEVYSPLDGVVHSLQDNASKLDYGPTIILEHKIHNDLSFYTLYGHLSRDSLQNKEMGQIISKGELMGSIGSYEVNGNWPPHLHFQIITDMLGNAGDFPGVALHSQKAVWTSICPDPNTILSIPSSLFPESLLTKEEILDSRETNIGKSLSVAYHSPLKIMRGSMQYLYDEAGRKYLDAVNNVPHVGHSHPAVVKAIQQQTAVLNTNTRYLHDNLIKYAKQLGDTLPDPLQVCFFVNSGSEANELALRIAQTYTRQKNLLVLDGAYHGNTGLLVDISPYKFDGPGGEGAPPHVHKLPMPDPYRGKYKGDDAGKKYSDDVKIMLDTLEGEGKGVAAFIFEPLLGCGGQIIMPEGYLKHAMDYVHDAGG
ncbi:MAG: aminotransferase class III-fold pyridoxal phosphate-dependent enzyme, partial [Candidatus Kariarchaeaceae archaeon]